MSFNVSGLASGLDTSALIDALMFAERATVRRLESSKAQASASLNAWSDIEAKLGTLDSAVAAIRTGGALQAATAESSNESVLRVSAQGSALPGSYALRVNTLAAAQQVTSAGLAGGISLVGAGTATVSGGFATIGSEVNSHTLSDGTYNLTVVSINTGASEATVSFDGVEQTVSTVGGTMTVVADDGGTLTIDEAAASVFETGTAAITVVAADATTTLNGLAASLNAPGGPVRAQIIDTGDATASSYRMVITSRDTGLDSAPDIDLSGLSLFAGGLTTLRAASDASVSLGGGGLTITRPTNTIGDLLEGLTIDLVGVSPATDVEIVVAADVDAKVQAITAVVDGVTDILGSLGGYSSYNVDAGVGGVLVGSFTARSVQRDLTVAMTTVVPASTIALLSQIGVTIENDGTYSIDEVELREVLSADSAGVELVLMGDPSIDDDGVLDVLNQTVTTLLQEAGRIPTAKDSAEQSISGLDVAIGNQEIRLEAVEDRFRRQFASLEALIGQLQSQGNFLSSMLGTGAAT